MKILIIIIIISKYPAMDFFSQDKQLGNNVASIRSALACRQNVIYSVPQANNHLVELDLGHRGDYDVMWLHRGG